MSALLLPVCLFALGAIPGHEDGMPALEEKRVITVSQDEGGDFQGSDDTAIRRGLKELEETGGVLSIEAGRYLVRKTIFVPPGVTLRGEAGALLALPRPTRTTEPRSAGAGGLQLEKTDELLRGTRVEVLPPAGSEFFADGETRSFVLRIVSAVDGELAAVDPLPVDVPAGSRVGYAHNIVQIGPDGNVVVENLTFDGGWVADLPMPGHHQRTALWASAPFGFGEVRKGPPARRVEVRHCVFRNCYGRGVAFYHVEDVVVEGSRFMNIADEAIDLDHFCRRARVVGNDIEGAIWGIVLNDAADCVVEYNRVRDTTKGIFVWWYERTPREGLNRGHVIRHNLVTGSSEAAIHLARHCHDNEVVQNFVGGKIQVDEDTNEVDGNTRL